MVICLERDVNYLHALQLMPLAPIISCFFEIGLTILMPANPGCPGTEAIKRVSVFFAIRVRGTKIDCLIYCCMFS